MLQLSIEDQLLLLRSFYDVEIQDADSAESNWQRITLRDKTSGQVLFEDTGSEVHDVIRFAHRWHSEQSLSFSTTR